MESNNGIQILENKAVLVIGASGFLAKVFVEKILRIQPNVKKLYLLVRASDNESAMQRLRSEVFGKDLFRVLRNDLGVENFNTLISEKISPVPGDITVKDLGVKDSDLRQKMWKEIDIIINGAATTVFDERYDVALGINTFGAFNVLGFAKNCHKAQLLLHVSTAYVCGEKTGLILEKSLAMGETLNKKDDLDINREVELANQKMQELQNQSFPEEEITQKMKDLGIERAKQHGWPNTYVFTKAMAEMLVGNHRDNLPLVILRPTMITSSLNDPFPGWIEGLRTLDSVIVAYGKGRLKCFLADKNSVLDLIPVDMLVNAMIAAMAAHGGDPAAQAVYHVGSSFKNPVTFGQLHKFATRYFTKSPLIGRDGSPIVVPRGTVLPTMARFNLYTTLRYKLPLQLLRVISIICPWRHGDDYNDLDRKIKLAMKLVELYKPYVLFRGIFDDINTEKLRIGTKKTGKELGGWFNFDPKCIDWENYISNTHIPGLITYVLKK